MNNAATRRRALILLSVLLSGFSFLVYEVSWFRMLALMLGATVRASTVVLVAFTAGFGLGARFFGRRSTGRPRPARDAALLLLGVGLCGLSSHAAAMRGLPALYALLSGFGVPFEPAGLVALGAALAALLPPAFLMGGFLPVAARLAVRDDRDVARTTGRLYAVETLGSALGALAAGFLLIRWLGQPHALHLAAALNLLVALLLARADRPEVGEPSGESEAKDPPAAAPDRRAALLTALAFGFAGAGLQVAWFRILRVYLTNTSYTFSLVTAVVILGFFLGGHLFSRRAAPGGRRSLAGLLLCAALAVSAGFLILVHLPELVMFPLAGEGGSTAVRLFVIPGVAALLALLPATLVSGYAFPMACALLSPGRRGIGDGIGRAYLANAAGCALGPPLAAFALIPGKGAALTLLLFAAALASASAALALRPAAAAATAAALLLGPLLFPVVRVLPPSFARYDRGILMYEETTEGTWLVAKGAGGREVAASAYVNNSAVIGSTYDAVKAVKLVGHLPFYAGLKCREALVVGFGIGVTTGAIASHPEVERIDCVELVEGLRKAAGHYAPLNGNVHLDRRLNLVAGDGRHFLQATGRTYDLVSSDPTHPVLGSGSLYTREYFELCRARLNPGGMVSQYLPLHKLRLHDLLGIVKTFRAVFPGATVWLGHSHAVLLGRVEAGKVDFAAFAARAAASPKDPFFHAEPYHLAACLLLDAAAVDGFPDGVRENRDDRPLTEFFALSALDAGNAAVNLAWLDERRVGVEAFFSGIPDAERMGRFVAGNRRLTEGIVRDLSGDRAGFMERLASAVAENPENEEYPFLMRYFR